MEFVGYVAFLVLVCAFVIKNILKKIYFYISGSIIFAFYGISIGSYPVMIAGLLILFYNIYHFFIIKLDRKKSYLRIVNDIDFSGKFTEDFINYNNKEIIRYFPDFNLCSIITNDESNIECLYLFRKMLPVGIFLIKRTGRKQAELLIDYINSKYRGLTEAPFLTYGKNYIKEQMDIKKICAYTSVPDYSRHLEKQGFYRNENEIFKFILEL
ncbi:MAG: hypothetical protein K9L78_03580 [Victivallales bacterium]|nr:hypothetical protein [Victivallales bacterium]MCF7889181.1 hypothetical protein [Victivallales bacterium]